MANPITQIIISAIDNTKAAFASAKGGLASLGETATGVSGILRSLFAGIGIVYFVGKLKGVVDSMNDVADSAARAGTTAEKLTALQYAGKQSGIDDMQKSLVALADALDSAKTGSGDAFDAFVKLKIDPAQFDDPADALDVLAERFALLPNGVTKTNLAIDIFTKKLGPGMVPLLNEGAAGLNRLKEAAAAAGKVMSNEAAAAADKFGDSLDNIKAHAAGAAQGIISPLLPSLNQYLAAMDDVINKGSTLDKIRFFGLGNITPETLDRITSATEKLADEKERLNEIIRGSLFLDTTAVAKQKEVIRQLELGIEAEKKAAAAKTANAKASEKALLAEEAAQEKRKTINESFKKSVNEQISDADRLQSALQSAFSQSIKDETDYLRQAKKLRAEASAPEAPSADPQSQAFARMDAIIALTKLQRIASSASLEDVQDQAEAVRNLAAGLEDATVKTLLLKQAKLAEAAALERAGAEEAARVQGLAEQMKANEARIESTKAALDGIGKEVSVDVKPGPQMEKTKQDLTEILSLLDKIGSRPLSVGFSADTSNMADLLRTEALKNGRR